MYMIIFPAIDILDGKAVRLFRGDYQKSKIYGDPYEMSRKWIGCGAKYLHVVDLNGARGDRGANTEIIKKIAKDGLISVQVGGGIRSREDVARCFDMGIDRIIFGSACVKTPDLVERAIGEYGADRIICGVDSLDGKVSIGGWKENTDRDIKDVCNEMKSLGATTIICTDIAKDGTMQGADENFLKELVLSTGMKVIASGGINSEANLVGLAKAGAYGAILGKSLYEGKISLRSALTE